MRGLRNNGSALISLLSIFLLLSDWSLVVFGDDGAYYNNNAADDAGNNNAYYGYEYYQQAEDDDREANYAGDDFIKYWTDYAILPKKCITYNNVDMIVFSVFETAWKQCSDDPMGTYMTSVPTFVGAYMDQIEANNLDMGNDDWQLPDSADYINCYPYENPNSGNVYYVQLGCTDGTSQSLSVNIYKDNICSEPDDSEDGYNDAQGLDVSDLQLPFKQCQACVIWVDKNEDDVDDQYFINKKKNAPLCSQVWSDKEECNRKCQKMGLEPRENQGWNNSDKVLLVILSLFGAGMLVAILKKRSKMSNKDALLEQAAMSAAGLQQTHVIGIFILVVLVIFVFALLGLKSITWVLLLVMNTVLFGYLMKLTVDSGVNAGSTMIGPDGQIIQRDDDSDDSDDEDDEEEKGSSANEAAGDYKSPSLPPVS
mmetsp:Transcript_19611/g.27586  ORF Transcript_19611/g.27586 Transcript_19611/m.27586 type:complete len:425 (+) Transcript_19611:240-1514(+)|eukprot:CAMPEP_0184856450 /NCGR_PEP_ID=MMETSP0580-20130426/1643_1 /TAXON_ID=1118495 /ORGANISM="Dactyliosolen fragilissimus" /LENGTH=424 /DNA_ID=CAMNT_0027351501 /DNA_START=168 /DNA_END=1442 /DNA_ORIENTATION=+